MSKKVIFSVITVCTVLLVFMLVKNFIYQSHRDIANENTFKQFSTKQFLDAFKENETIFLKTYVNQTIAIYGNTMELDFENQIVLIDGKIAARFIDFNPATKNNNQKTVIKGRFVGYDDLLEEFQMDQCVIINKTE
jgi:hypothetical protein